MAVTCFSRYSFISNLADDLARNVAHQHSNHSLKIIRFVGSSGSRIRKHASFLAAFDGEQNNSRGMSKVVIPSWIECNTMDREKRSHGRTTVRLRKLDEMIRNGCCRSATQAATELGVKPRTIMRDIVLLRDQHKAPIE